MGKSARTNRRSTLERQLEERRAANRLAWARRHPGIAAEERALRKARAEIVERHGHKNDGTPETHEHARRQEGALARLYRSGAIDSEQLHSATEIAAVADRIALAVTVKTASLETRVDIGARRHDSIHDEKLGQVRREMAYTRWRALLQDPAPVLDMIVGDPVGFTIVAARYGMGNKRAKRLLIEALDLWPEILGDMFRAVDQRDLDWAHARLAA